MEKSLCVVREIQYVFVIIWAKQGVFFFIRIFFFFWMGTIFNVFIEFVKTLLVLYFGHEACGSLSRD